MRSMTTQEKNRSWRTFVRWPGFLLANLALLLIIGVSTVRETYRGWTVDREIKALEAQASSLEGGKLQLEMLTKDLVSPERVEYEARARLGRKKPGERVIVLEGMSPSATWSGGLSGEETEGAEKETVELTNPQRWRRYFF